jgi:hypothetical protein
MRALLSALLFLMVLAARSPSYGAAEASPTGPTALTSAPIQTRAPGSQETHVLLREAQRSGVRVAGKALAAGLKPAAAPRGGVRAIERGAPSPSAVCPHTQVHLQSNGSADANGRRC